MGIEEILHRMELILEMPLLSKPPGRVTQSAPQTVTLQKSSGSWFVKKLSILSTTESAMTRHQLLLNEHLVLMVGVAALNKRQAGIPGMYFFNSAFALRTIPLKSSPLKWLNRCRLHPNYKQTKHQWCAGRMYSLKRCCSIFLTEDEPRPPLTLSLENCYLHHFCFDINWK